jgi:hypothetical protein
MTMSTLKQETITRKKPVPAFSGVGSLLESDGNQILIVAANGEVLAALLAEMMPQAEADPANFKPVTIIEAK